MFIDGLVRPLYKVMAPQMNTFPSYSAIMDCVRMLEMNEIEDHASQKKTKKHKTKGTYSVQSSATSSKSTIMEF